MALITLSQSQTQAIDHQQGSSSSPRGEKRESETESGVRLAEKWVSQLHWVRHSEDWRGALCFWNHLPDFHSSTTLLLFIVAPSLL